MLFIINNLKKKKKKIILGLLLQNLCNFQTFNIYKFGFLNNQVIKGNLPQPPSPKK